MATGIAYLIRALPSTARVKTITVIFFPLLAQGRVVLHGGVPGSAAEDRHVGLSVQAICVSRVQEPVITVIA